MLKAIKAIEAIDWCRYRITIHLNLWDDEGHLKPASPLHILKLDFFVL
jgi:hypothetical protein